MTTSISSVIVGYRTHSTGPVDKYLDVKGGNSQTGTYWQQKIVRITQSNSVTTPFQFIINGKPGNPQGAVGIDDITFGPGCK